MKCLSLAQPLCWLILESRIDDCRVINADERIDLEPGRAILIHAGDYREDIAEWVNTKFGIWTPRPNAHEKQPLKTGGIVGDAIFVDCVRGHKSRWANPNKWNVIIRNPFPARFMPHPGGTGLFDFICEKTST